MIVRLENTIRNYAWGSLDQIAEFLGRQPSATNPQAELWIGAHPDDSSRALLPGGQKKSLLAVIAEAPVEQLGAGVAARFGNGLPYLMKVLAAGSPLSLQAHPTIEQARAGYDDEERRGVPQDAPHRNYRDRNHKPELMFALSPFEALCGFRPVTDIIATFERIAVPKMLDLATRLRTTPNAQGLKSILEFLLIATPGQHAELVAQTLAVADAGKAQPGPEQNHLRWISKLGRAYPGDVGVVTALLLNYVALEIGQAIFLPARSLHSYLSGIGIELMASSDNVLRGGLTPKYVDGTELLHVLSFEPMPPPIVTPTALSAVEQAFVTPAADFRLSRIQLSTSLTLCPVGPEVLLCSEGEVTIEAPGEEPVTLGRGESAFVGACHVRVSLSGLGTLFRATVGKLD